MLDIALESIAAEQLFWDGNQFQSHSYHTHSQLNTHLRIMALDLH